MSTLGENTILSYKQDCVNFIKSQIEYTNNNLNKTGEMCFDFKSGDVPNVFKYLENVIHSSVKIYDKYVNNNITQDEKQFMSGVKHIDNTIKHQDSNVEIELWKFVRAEPAPYDYEIKKSNEKNTSITIITKFFFCDISFIPCKPKYENQRKNYLKHIKGKDVNFVIIEIEKILKKLVYLGKMPSFN